MKDFPQAEVFRAATFGGKVVKFCCSFHHHLAYNGKWELLILNPMIHGVNMLLKDVIFTLGIENGSCELARWVMNDHPLS